MKPKKAQPCAGQGVLSTYSNIHTYGTVQYILVPLAPGPELTGFTRRATPLVAPAPPGPFRRARTEQGGRMDLPRIKYKHVIRGLSYSREPI